MKSLASMRFILLRESALAISIDVRMWWGLKACYTAYSSVRNLMRARVLYPAFGLRIAAVIKGSIVES